VNGVEPQRAWWANNLAALRLDSSTLIRLARVGARLVPDSAGASALGGVPQMPSGWQWPVWECSLQYIARISLSALATVLDEDARRGLAASGTLHLFADALGNGWGTDEEHAGSFAAFIADGDTTFATPHATDWQGNVIPLEHPEQPMALVPELVLPSPLAFTGTVLSLDDASYDAYSDLHDAFNEEHFAGAAKHRICGLPDILNPSEEGLPEGTDWRLLAQMDTDAPWFFHPTPGVFHWWLDEPHFRTGHVEQCWGTVQNL